MSRRYHLGELPAPGQRAVLGKDTSHHMLQVCRHPRGEAVVLFDGQGREAHGRLVAVERGRAVVEIQERTAPCAPARRVTLLLALCKPAAWETSLRMGTELGLDHVIPVLCARSTVRKLRLERWHKVLLAACEQSGRRWLPTIQRPLGLPEALQEPSLPSRRLLMAPGAAPLPRPDVDIALLVGPEGGLTDDESALTRAAGFEPAGLGSHVLRVDTAVAAALTRYGG